MDTAARPADFGQYRWRGDGLARDVESIDYLHGLTVDGYHRVGEEGERRSGASQTADSRLIHWDLFESVDAPSRTA